MLLKRQREVKEALKHETAKKRVKIEEKQRDNFRKHMSGRFAERQTSSDLYKSQKACEQLDKSKVRSCKDVRSSLINKFLFSCLILGKTWPHQIQRGLTYQKCFKGISTVCNCSIALMKG